MNCDDMQGAEAEWRRMVVTAVVLCEGMYAVMVVAAGERQNLWPEKLCNKVKICTATLAACKDVCCAVRLPTNRM